VYDASHVPLAEESSFLKSFVSAFPSWFANFVSSNPILLTGILLMMNLSDKDELGNNPNILTINPNSPLPVSELCLANRDVVIIRDAIIIAR
jgi:hypothetical protein